MDHVKVYIDENLPAQLAKGFDLLQQPLNQKERVAIEVLSIKEVFGQGAADEDWLPQVGKENAVVITQDYQIQNQRHQKELYLQAGAGLLFIKPPSKRGFSYWQMVKLLVDRWDEIKGIISKNKPPFAFRCSAKTRFVRIDE